MDVTIFSACMAIYGLFERDMVVPRQYMVIWEV